MRRFFKIFVFVLIVWSFALPQQNFVLDPYNPTYEPNTILVKFKDQSHIDQGLAKSSAQTGISSIDSINSVYGVESMEKVFRNAKPVLSKRTFKDYNGIDDDGNGYIDDIRRWDYINDDNDPNDDNSHGTHVAGIAAAEGNNGIGITGVAYDCHLMLLKVLRSSGRGNSRDLAVAIDYASNNGVSVINMSLGSYGESLTVKYALERAYAYTILVGAAGSDRRKLIQEGIPSGNHFPECYSFVLGVEASNNIGSRARFSNIDPTGPIKFINQWGFQYEVKSPGVGIYNTFPNGNYNSLNGSSMSSLIVAGAVSLKKKYNPSQSMEQIFARLIQSSNNGIIDIKNSFDYNLQPDLHYVDYTLVDTLSGCDGDGIADPGETVEIYLTVKNSGGLADSMWSKLRFASFEDTAVANIISIFLIFEQVYC